jgi:hypothetical protein
MVTLTINNQRSEISLNLRSYDDIVTHIRILELISYEKNLIEGI